MEEVAAVVGAQVPAPSRPLSPHSSNARKVRDLCSNHRKKAVRVDGPNGPVVECPAEKSGGLTTPERTAAEGVELGRLPDRFGQVQEEPAVLGIRMPVPVVNEPGERGIAVPRITRKVLRPEVGRRAVGEAPVAIFARQL